jgi:predicted  nucleic acid-binding Zn-ribbon protein
MFNLCCDDSHQNMQMLLDMLKNIENEVTGTRRQLSLRLERLELDVVGIGRQLGAFDVAIDSTIDRIESLEDGFSHMRPQLFFTTEESLERLVSRFDNLEDEVVKIGYQLSNDVDKLAKTMENHPRKT